MSRPKIKRKKLAKGTFRTAEGLVGHDLGPCPYCGGRIGAIGEGQLAAMRSFPACPKFEAEDPLTFLHNMRMKVVGPVPDDDEWPMPIKQEPS
jgi:hypothetical protein